MEYGTGPGEMMPSLHSNVISCHAVSRLAPLFCEELLSEGERRGMEEHLSQCAKCVREVREFRNLKKSLRSLPVRRPPAALRTQLRVVASREISQRHTNISWMSMWNTWQASFRLRSQILMRPLAIPTAGGFLSALILFACLPLGMLSPVLADARMSMIDVPTQLYTEASVKSTSPVSFGDDDVVVELTIDDQGRILDYKIADCPHILKTPGLRRTIEHNLLFTQFTPATTFGQPMSGKIRISFRNSKIDVKG
jgi:hypothetical protein